MSTATLDPPTRFLTTEEVSAITGIGFQTLCNWRSTRKAGPPFVRLSGKFVRYERAAVERWIQEQTVDPKG
jgi:predicted DNA-binding transcriptional regulator AlpA